MKTLTYWFAPHVEHKAYNIRRLTKKACQDAVDAYKGDSTDAFHEAPKKVTVVYTNPLDLLDQALGEGGIEY